jgi:subtilisin family serine protease
MALVKFGRKDEPGFELELSKDLLAVRTRSRDSLQSRGPVRTPLSAEVDDGQLVAHFPEAGVEVYRVPVRGAAGRPLSARKEALRTHPDVQFAGGVMVDPASGEPVLYTENLFIKFEDTADPEDCEQTLTEEGLAIKEKLDYAVNAYWVQPPQGTGRAVFELALRLLQREEVEYCHPELVRTRDWKGIFPQQWHLKPATIQGVAISAHAAVEAAHEIAQGEGVTIAVIDDGVDTDHPEFASVGKIVAPRDVTAGVNDARPKDPDPRSPDNHGTACAGVACGDGTTGASGVAPKARLLPIRLSAGIGSVQEAQAFRWAADNGADVISCSWGPPDGRWWLASDPLHNRVMGMPASTRLAIDYAVTNGRGGKGCVVLFAAGNGNESVDNDGYASYEKVVAVAACNDRGTRSVYSDFGAAVWCAFPSNDFGHAPFNHPSPLTPGIWTTDRRGPRGYNGGDANRGDAAGDFTNGFGGTSSSCPGAAGVAALILSANPALNWQEVKDLLKQCCDRIDPQGGEYAANGHSRFYGYGRLNARRAVELAKPQPRDSVMVTRNFDAPLPDLQTREFSLQVSDSSVVATVAVSLELLHTYIGDLRITLTPPSSTGAGSIVLHNRAGGSGKNLKRTYDASSVPKLASLAGKKCNGSWNLKIEDKAAQDSGTLVSFGVELRFGTGRNFRGR